MATIDDQVKATRELAQIQRKNSIIDNVSAIPPFNGEPHSTSCEEFLQKLETLASFFMWEPEEKKFVLLNRISGAPARLLKSQHHKNFDELINLLKERFVRQDSPDVALSRFMGFRQIMGMPVQDFFDRATDLSLNALVVHGLDSDVVDQSRKSLLFSMLMSNLLPEIRKGVIAKDPKTPEQVLAFALLEEKALKSVNPFYDVSDFSAPSNFLPPPQTAPMPCAAAIQPSSGSSSEKELSELREKLDLLTAKIESLVVRDEAVRETSVNRDQKASS